MTAIIFAVAVCMGWQDGSANCQLASGSEVYHQSEQSCDRMVTAMNNGRPQGNNPSIWYECLKKEVPTWQRVVR